MQANPPHPIETPAPGPTRQIGVSRPALEVADLPTPEEVYHVKRVGLEELALFVLGPSLIALAVSLGSGEWLLGPLNLGRYGFAGLGWVILVSALLQVFYNVELARFTLATGETPVVAFGRTPPGALIWIPLALFSFYLAFILGGWAVSAGTSLFAMITGRLYTPGELETVRLLGIGLLVVALLFFMIGRKVERTLEVVMGVLLIFMLVSMITVSTTVVPGDYWQAAISSVFIFTRPPAGVTVDMVGAVAGFTALAAGLNFMFIGYYRDKGYGMGARMGALPSFFNSQARRNPESFPSHGVTFTETEANAATWRRWFRYLLLDQWGIYLPGVLIGMLVPAVLVYYLGSLPGAPLPNDATIFVFAAQQLGAEFGPLLYGWSLLIGFLMLFTTQVVILELLARNLTDAVFSFESLRLRRLTGASPRAFYFAALVALVVIIGVLIHLALPLELIVFSGNLSNMAAMIFPLALIYLNRQLPKPARPSWIYQIMLIANALFFGFFFINFVVAQFTGAPLIRF